MVPDRLPDSASCCGYLFVLKGWKDKLCTGDTRTGAVVCISELDCYYAALLSELASTSSRVRERILLDAHTFTCLTPFLHIIYATGIGSGSLAELGSEILLKSRKTQDVSRLV